MSTIINKLTRSPALLAMQQLKKNQFPLALSCFTPDTPNIAFISSVIERKMTGYVFVNRTINPSWAYVLTDAGISFLSPGVPFNIIETLYYAIKKTLGDHDDTKIILPSLDFKDKLQKSNLSFIERLEFGINSQDFDFHPINVSKEFTLERIDKANLQLCHLKEVVLKKYGSVDNYLKNTAGYCLLFKGNVVSEAHTVISSKYSEIGVYTSQKFRKQGLSTIVSKKLISHYLKNGIDVKWSCNIENTGSINLALKIGFKKSDNYLALTPCI